MADEIKTAEEMKAAVAQIAAAAGTPITAPEEPAPAETVPAEPAPAPAPAPEPEKEIDTQAIIDNLFNNKPEPEEKVKKGVKAPVNIFSKAIPVTQDDEARKARMKMIIIEGLLFGAFLTAITVIFSLSGLEMKLDPENGVNTPSIWFFLLEFVVFSIVFTIGDYFLTEHRVNMYNAQMAGVNINMEDEIDLALKAQEAEGISAEDAAAQNRSNRVEAAIIEIRCVQGETSLTDKSFEAYIGDEKVGNAATCKGVILDSNGFENVVLRMTQLFAAEGEYKNGVVMELIAAAKNAAADNTLAAVVIPKSVYGDLELNLSDGAKYKIQYPEEIKVQEAYPGALMGISGELK
ncbi:MAG: hypothetical protein II473_04835 [Clostridia bacterium]|nr:hypothetical protein [Clostridia bacterium]